MCCKKWQSISIRFFFHRFQTSIFFFHILQKLSSMITSKNPVFQLIPFEIQVNTAIYFSLHFLFKNYIPFDFFLIQTVFFLSAYLRWGMKKKSVDKTETRVSDRMKERTKWEALRNSTDSKKCAINNRRLCMFRRCFGLLAPSSSVPLLFFSLALFQLNTTYDKRFGVQFCVFFT